MVITDVSKTCEAASYAPSCVEVGSVVSAVGDDENKKGKERRGTKSHKIVTFHVFVQKPRDQILSKFCTEGGIGVIIIYANFCLDKIRGLGI